MAMLVLMKIKLTGQFYERESEPGEFGQLYERESEPGEFEPGEFGSAERSTLFINITH